MHSHDVAHLKAILDAAEKIMRYTIHLMNAEELYRDDKSLDAVLMNFVVIGECVVRLSDDALAHDDQVPWKSIRRFRNIIAHDYFGVDVEAVWQIIQNHLPHLIEYIKAKVQLTENE